MTDSILVFIPVYNCEKQLPRVLAQFTEDIRPWFREILIVDNGSQDNTLEVGSREIEKMNGIPCRLVQNMENYGLGGSHKVAFNYCLEKGYDNLVVLHGDDQGHIADLIPYLEKGENRCFDSLLGSRFSRESRLVGYSAFRTWGNVIFNFLISIVTGLRVTDMGAGLNCYKSDFLSKRFYMVFPDDLTFNVYMLYYSIWKQSLLRFFPLTWREDDQISNAKVVKQTGIILGLTFCYLINAERLFDFSSQRLEKQYTFRTIAVNYEES